MPCPEHVDSCKPPTGQGDAEAEADTELLGVSEVEREDEAVWLGARLVLAVLVADTPVGDGVGVVDSEPGDGVMLGVREIVGVSEAVPLGAGVFEALSLGAGVFEGCGV